MSELPIVLASSVVRSAHQGESHGGLYLVDLASGSQRMVIDWNTWDINWEGRGLDRGLRGIALHNEEVWVAAADELFVYDTNFELKRSFRNRYLGHCHEISLYGEALYLTSTGFDSILKFDLATEQFTRAWVIRRVTPADVPNLRLDYREYDPQGPGGPAQGDTIHINNVHADERGLFLSAFYLPVILKIADTGVAQAARIPPTTHNARPFRDGVLLNNTGEEFAEYRDDQGELRTRFPIPRYPENDLINGHLPTDYARQAFARGLCIHNGEHNDVLIVGSSPATVIAYQLDSGEVLSQVNLTMDVRHAVHGLEIWPFDSAILKSDSDASETVPANEGNSRETV